ncbi:MAG TPA: hypothetical protein VKT76_12905 [Bradyrhizobium sp.]|nr:hypothetical protein [Bradyrhizobium sp.]
MTVALSLISGAAQLAMGRDLNRDLGRNFSRNLNHSLPAMPFYAARSEQVESDQLRSLPSSSSGDGSIKVNRGAKANRMAGPLGSPARTKTVQLRLEGLSNTSFLLRVPIANIDSPSSHSPNQPAARKPMVACEPLVSILTEAARQLQPGRCVT